MNRKGYKSVKNNKRNRKKLASINKSQKTSQRLNKYDSIKKLVKERKFTKALSEIEDYLYEYPDEEFGLNLYASILTSLQKDEEAKKVLNRLIHMDAKNKYSAMYKLGNIEKKTGNRETAELIYKRIIKESPYEEGLTKVALAQIYKEDHKIEEAKELLLSIKDESKEAALLELSKIALNQDNTVESFNYISQIKKTDSEPFNRNVLIQKGIIEASFNDYKQAKDYLEEALNGPKDNNYITARLKLIELEIKFEHFEKALFICDDMIQNGELVNGEIYISKGQIYVELAEYDKAREYYNKAKTEANEVKKNGKIAFYMGLLNFKEQKYTEAISNLTTSSHTRKYRKPSLLNLVYSNIRKKDYKNAKYYLGMLLKESILSKEDEEIVKIMALINKNLDEPIKLEKSYSYSVGQYISYSEEEAYKHIEKNHYGEEYDRSVFNDDINLEELILDVKTKFSDDKKEVQGLVDCYYIDMDDIGKTKENKNCNMVKVVVIPDTKDIITMFPVVDRFNTKEKEKPKVKKMSRIDKFNKKYGFDQ